MGSTSSYLFAETESILANAILVVRIATTSTGGLHIYKCALYSETSAKVVKGYYVVIRHIVCDIIIFNGSSNCLSLVF